MDALTKVLKDKKYSLRTQISLSVQLRKMIDAKRRLYGETLAEYLRKAALIRLMIEDEEKRELKYLAKTVVGSIPKSKSGWKRVKDIISWQKNQRQKEDEHRNKISS